jgi:PAS domain S-box-containing protein
MGAGSQRALRVLLVEDSEDDAELLMRQLRKGTGETGGPTWDLVWERVTTAVAFEEALDRGPWDVVVADYLLPRFSGTEAIAALRARGADVPIIVVSGTLGEDVAVAMMKAGARDFFSKGNLRRLASAVEREVGEAQIRRQRLLEQRRADEERHRLTRDLKDAVQARDTFLTMAAHELRTPLMSLQLQLERVRRSQIVGGTVGEANHEAVAAAMMSMGRQLSKLGELVDNLVDVSRIAAGQLSLTFEAVDLDRLVREVVLELSDLTARSSSVVTIRSSGAVVGRWNRIRIKSVVANLLSNAIKFGMGRPIDVTVASEGTRARLTVADRGIGISPEEHKRIFGRFEQAVPAEHRPGSGLGLGLWITREVVEAHQGHVSLDSREGEGSTFVVELPLASPVYASASAATGPRAGRDAADRANRFLDSIVEQIPYMIFVKEARELRFERINLAGEALLGVSREDLLGRNDYDFFPKEQADFFQEKDRQTLERGVIVDIPEEPIETTQGRRWLHTRKVPLLDADGTPRYLLGISEDITERKRTAEALRAAKVEAEAASQELEAFTLSVAHDLRGPLRAIDGFSEAVVEDAGGRLDAATLAHLERVRAASERMGRMLDDLLHVSTFSSAALRSQEVDLSAIAEAAVLDLRQANPGRDVQVVVAPDLKDRGDPWLLRIVLDNLLGNAFKFTAPRPKATIEFGARVDETGRAYFVRDDGVGFDPERAKGLFVMFRRLHDEHEFPGTGIGLATVERIVRRHQGRVWAEATLGGGATFYFTLAISEDRS